MRLDKNISFDGNYWIIKYSYKGIFPIFDREKFRSNIELKTIVERAIYSVENDKLSKQLDYVDMRKIARKVIKKMPFLYRKFLNYNIDRDWQRILRDAVIKHDIQLEFNF
jgi:hypothetical protein